MVKISTPMGPRLWEKGTYSELLVLAISQIHELAVFLVLTTSSLISTFILPGIVCHQKSGEYYGNRTRNYYGNFRWKIVWLVGIPKSQWTNDISHTWFSLGNVY